jgi:PKHD-type hydroxylase
MLIELRNAISEDVAKELVAMTSAARFVSGLATAAGSAAQVKHNVQLDVNSDLSQQAGGYLLKKLRENVLFEAATLPARVVPPRFSRYYPGMRYGDHLDAPLMGDLPPLRTDIAVTVFLADPATYDGGELVIDTDYGIQRVKGGFGDCVIYPANTIHRVEEVTRGERAVGFLWIQSLVRDPAKRKILFDLIGTAEYLDHTTRGGHHVDVLRRTHSNLIRMWAES